MKYSIQPVVEKTKFVPYEITFLIETEEESKILHDEFAVKIAESSQFIADVFLAGRGPLTASGNVPLDVSRK